jgi:rhodanese-related sulfurtransferase
MRFAVVALALVAACSHSDDPAPPPAPPPAPAGHVAETKPSKDPAKARQVIAAGGAVVLDVRTPEEFGDHLPTATNVPVDDLPKRLAEVDHLAGGDKAKPIVVYCHAGGRAARAKRALEAAGYTNVTNGGGIDDLR